MRQLTRTERRCVEKWCNKTMRRLESKAFYNHETGEKVFRVEDIIAVLGMNKEQYAAALEITGMTDTVRTEDMRNFGRVQ